MIRSRKDIKQKLLKKAFREGRGPEMIALISERFNRATKLHPEHKREMALFEILNGLQPKAIRAHNYSQKLNGNGQDSYIYDPVAFINHISRN